MKKTVRLTIELTYEENPDKGKGSGKITPIHFNSEMVDVDTGERYETDEGHTTRQGWALGMSVLTYTTVAMISDVALRFKAMPSVIINRFFRDVSNALNIYHPHNDQTTINPN